MTRFHPGGHVGGIYGGCAMRAAVAVEVAMSTQCQRSSCASARRRRLLRNKRVPWLMVEHVVGL